jgi:hypothetical protein
MLAEIFYICLIAVFFYFSYIAIRSYRELPTDGDTFLLRRKFLLTLSIIFVIKGGLNIDAMFSETLSTPQVIFN